MGTSLEETNEAVGSVERFLIISGSVAVVVFGIGALFLAGAALRPVERMRRQADAISDRDTDARLMVPHSRDEIARLGRTMNRLLDRLQGALGRQRNFVADAGHELRTPISVLQTELELAGRPGRTEEELREAIGHAIARDAPARTPRGRAALPRPQRRRAVGALAAHTATSGRGARALHRGLPGTRRGGRSHDRRRG